MEVLPNVFTRDGIVGRKKSSYTLTNSRDQRHVELDTASPYRHAARPRT